MLVFLNGCPHIRGQNKFEKFSRRNLRLALGLEPGMLANVSKRELTSLATMKGDVGRINKETIERYQARHGQGKSTP